MTARNDIRLAVQNNFLAFTGGHFTYTSVNVKDYDIAGLTSTSFPVINIILLDEENNFQDNIGKLDIDMKMMIEGIPYADEITAQEEIDKVLEDIKTVILSDPQLGQSALDSVYIKSNVFALGTDLPALTTRVEFTVSYRETRPLCNQ